MSELLSLLLVTIAISEQPIVNPTVDQPAFATLEDCLIDDLPAIQCPMLVASN